MFIFGGTEQEMEALGYLGVASCNNCGNSTHHILYELVKSASVYFVPVAKWGKGSYVVCEGCEAGIEVSDEQKEFLLRECRQIPEPERYADIWNGLSQGWSQEGEHAVTLGEAVSNFAVTGSEKISDFDDFMQAARREVQGQFPDSEIRFVENWSFVPERARAWPGQVALKQQTLLTVLD